MKPSITKLQWLILNATADDWEAVSSILGDIQKIDPTVSKERMTESIRDLFSQGLVERMPLDGQDPADLTDMNLIWFSMTASGREMWDSEEKLFFPET